MNFNKEEKTEMSEKEYLFAGNDSLQKNIDQINLQ